MRFRKIAAVAVAMGVAVAAVTYSTQGISVHASSLSNLQSKKQQLQSEINQVSKNLAATKNNIAKEAQYQASLNQQIQLNLQKVAVMEEELDLLAEELDQKSLELDEKNAELDQKETEIDATYEQYKQRMRAMYMAGDTSTLEMLFAADSFSDFLTNIEMMKAITAHDTELLDTLEVQKSSLTNQKTQVERLQIEIEEQQAEVETNKKALEETNQQLQVAYAESKTAMQDIELEKEQFEANLEAKKKEASQVQSEINAIYAELAAAASNSNNSTMKDGNFIWPLPGYSTITSGYGSRWGSTHTGIDISGGGCYGAGIVAAPSSRRGAIGATATTSLSITAADTRPFTPIAPSCWSARGRTWRRGRRSLWSAPPVSPRGRTFTSKCGSTARPRTPGILSDPEQQETDRSDLIRSCFCENASPCGALSMKNAGEKRGAE